MTMAAIEDVQRLAPWAQGNRDAIADERVEGAVLRGLGGPVAPDLAVGTPLLRYANTDLPALPLIEALIENVRHDHRACDRCNTHRLSVLDSLWVLCGASVVEVAVCWHCRIELDPYRNRLVWREVPR